MTNFSHRGLVPLPELQGLQSNINYNPYNHQHYQGFHPVPQYGYTGPPRPIPGPQYATPIVQNAEMKIDEDKNIVEANKESNKRKKRGSIQGNTIVELVNNIIKEKATLKQARDAFKKIVEIVEDEKELNIFSEF